MTVTKGISLLFLGSLILCLGREDLCAQVFPDRRETAVFRDYLNTLASKQSAVFVSSCQGPAARDEAILIVPSTDSTARLELLSSREVYSAAILKIENGKLVITEGSGGQSSDVKLRRFLAFLSKSSFRFVPPDQTRDLLDSFPVDLCPSLD
jgi:hypothetical protein